MDSEIAQLHVEVKLLRQAYVEHGKALGQVMQKLDEVLQRLDEIQKKS